MLTFILSFVSLHVQLQAGSVFSGQQATALNLSEAGLREKFLEPRERGEEVWLQGKRFRWENATLRIFEGPPTSEIEDYTDLLGPEAYALSGTLKEVTDAFVQGAPGGRELAPGDERTGKAVFVVHGSNTARREEVARFLSQVLTGENPEVILHEQASRGRTLLEKFEANAAGARYAVVVLTADDEAKAVGSPELELRGRQNVVFELGFFFGKLGRAHVAVLYKESVRLPSDVEGLVYLRLDDAGAWKLGLARELKAAGLDADLNRLTE